MIRVAVVVEFAIESPDQVVELLRVINAPGLPGFAGKVRVVVASDVDALNAWLDE